MPEALLERDAQLEVLVGAVARGRAGARLDALVAGEAGHRQDEPRARAASSAGRRARACSRRRATTSSRRARSGRCTTRRGGATGPLAAALADDGPVDASSPRCWRSSPQARPTVLVVEDVHWADDATLDVLGYVGAPRRAARRGARPDRTATTSSIRAIRCTGCSARSPAARCTGSSCARCRATRCSAGGRHRARRRPPARAHARQPVLRHRGARRAAATRCRPA